MLKKIVFFKQKKQLSKEKKSYFCALKKRRVGRVVEGSGFENRRGVTISGGSNPSLSALRLIYLLTKKRRHKMTALQSIGF